MKNYSVVLLFLFSLSLGAQNDFGDKFADSALLLTKQDDVYDPADYSMDYPGGNVPHIGMVSNTRSADGNRYMLIHNIGNGQEAADCLFDFKITGHYFYMPETD
ncbi:MAG: DUF1287 domain-containing protein [Bacteroidales bacterium]|nr:DUF1287 domain-containing protein [Bacteroidales bacterium]MCF8399218.1 DUF1287 domain-containing protein [Bacteroidales bacterium]